MRGGDEGLPGRVAAVVRAGGFASERPPEEVAAQAELALQLAGRLAGRPERFAELAGSFDGAFDEWLLNLPDDLAQAGMVEQAVRVADALSAADERYDSDYACDAAMILAEAGRADEARARGGEPSPLRRPPVRVDVVRPGVGGAGRCGGGCRRS